MSASFTRIRFSLLASAASLLFSSCSSGGHAGEFSTALGKKIQAERPAVIDLATVSTIPWEEVFVFGPYTMRKDNCKLLEIGWLKCQFTFPSSVNEGEYTLVFRVNKEVVHSEQHARSNGDFYSQEIQLPQPVKRSAAKFTVLPTSNLTPEGKQWFQLQYKG